MPRTLIDASCGARRCRPGDPPVIPLAVPNLAGREAEYLQRCVTSTFVSSVGPFVSELEQLVAGAAGAMAGVALTSGTAGLHLALRCVGVGPGDLVVMPGLTFIASANAVAYCGATPWFMEVDPGSWTLDPNRLDEVFERELRPVPAGYVDTQGRRVGAVMPVHTLGHPADGDAIAEVAARYDVPVVADSAAAIGAEYRGRPIARTGAAASVFSFNGNKTVTAGGGGVVVANDEALLAHIRHLSTTARTGTDYDHDEVGYNYRMTNLQAAVGCAQMEQLEEFVSSKRRIQDTYTAHLGDLPGFVPAPEAAWARSARWFAAFALEGWSAEDVEQLRAALRSEGIDVRPFWKPMHLQRPYRDAPCDDLAFTEQLWQRVLTLPCSTGITQEQLEHVIAAVRRNVGS
jgi:perosamine synthetase